jgi:hypothetical protein
MAKASISLSLRDMYAIKHALQERHDKKNKRLEYLIDNMGIPFGYEEDEEIKRLCKDTTHEKALIKRVDRRIADFKARNRIK